MSNFNNKTNNGDINFNFYGTNYNSSEDPRWAEEKIVGVSAKDRMVFEQYVREMIRFFKKFDQGAIINHKQLMTFCGLSSPDYDFYKAAGVAIRRLIIDGVFVKNSNEYETYKIVKTGNAIPQIGSQLTQAARRINRAKEYIIGIRKVGGLTKEEEQLVNDYEKFINKTNVDGVKLYALRQREKNVCERSYERRKNKLNS